MKKIYNLILIASFLFCNGCGIVSLLGTPTRHERKIPAEYQLTERKEQKILVFVKQPTWINAQENLRYYLTGRINENLAKKLKIPLSNLVSYDELSQIRSNRSDFSLLSAPQVGIALGADIVLEVRIAKYYLYEMAETGYYKGFLGTQAILFDAVTGEKLWPKSEEGKNIRVGFEYESGDKKVGVSRLTTTLAHCTTRYLYNCPKNRFKISDDRSGIGWENWKE